MVRLPWQIYYSSPLNNNTNDTAARVIYTLDELGYDCVCSAVFVYPARMQFFRYLLPHQSYGFQVVTTVPSWQPEGLFSRLFKFSRPFDWVLWLCMFLSIFVSGLVMTYYERNTVRSLVMDIAVVAFTRLTRALSIPLRAGGRRFPARERVAER